MSVTDIIPDIHGQAEKLRVALRNLGWQRNGLTWSHPDPDRGIVFLGDFIDRGPENAAVIRIVRELIDAGRARAIMGNHELNALHFHTKNPETNLPLRAHKTKNFEQHASFLKEFPLGASHTKDVLDWMKGLQLFIEADGFRAVHAAWIQSDVDRLRKYRENGILNEDQLIRAARDGDEIHSIVETLTKGPEQTLPQPHQFVDKGGHVRRDIRVKWWGTEAKSWRDVAMSVPTLDDLPDLPLPDSFPTYGYLAKEKPVFFGHYWMSGQPVLQTENALCLDYSAGKDGPLVTYEMIEGDEKLDASRILVHDDRQSFIRTGQKKGRKG